MLRTKASDEEIGWLRQALQWIRAHKPEALTALFTRQPHGRPVVSEPPGPLLSPLLAFGLVERVAPGKIIGRRRMRVLGEHFYVLDLGLGDEAEYRQELWPETDALLEVLASTATPLRVLDLGTGSGVVAIEAAARGHSVVATDLFPTAIALARFNARLNGVEVELRSDWLWSAVAGERFDLILTNPHYGRIEDQLRLEVLRGAAAALSPGGRLRLATVLEWEGDQLGFEKVFADLRAEGLGVEVMPLESESKRDWFYEAVTPLPGVVSRHRFVVDVRRQGPSSTTWPRAGPQRAFVPISRLSARTDGVPVHAALVESADLDALSQVVSSLLTGTLRWVEPPHGLLDACRVGASACVGPRGATAALVRGYEVRPCTVGGVIGTTSDGVETLAGRLVALAAEAASRRGCVHCVAVAECSRCLYPLPLDDHAYCEWVRTHVAGLPLLRRLWATLEALDDAGAAWGPLTVHLNDATWSVELGDQRWTSTLDERGEVQLRPAT